MLEGLEVKNLVLVLAISLSITGGKGETLKCISYIRYPIQFKETNEYQVQALINLVNEVNVIYTTFVKKLGLSIRLIEIGA